MEFNCISFPTANGILSQLSHCLLIFREVSFRELEVAFHWWFNHLFIYVEVWNPLFSQVPCEVIARILRTDNGVMKFILLISCGLGRYMRFFSGIYRVFRMDFYILIPFCRFVGAKPYRQYGAWGLSHRGPLLCSQKSLMQGRSLRGVTGETTCVNEGSSRSKSVEMVYPRQLSLFGNGVLCVQKKTYHFLLGLFS